MNAITTDEAIEMGLFENHEKYGFPKKDKIQELIDSGVITTEQVLRYADDYYINTYQHTMDYDDIPSTTEIEFEKVPYPEYVVISTSYDAEETFAFPANENGEITDFGEIASSASRWGHEDWENQEEVIRSLNTNDHKYLFVKELSSSPCVQSLWKMEKVISL